MEGMRRDGEMRNDWEYWRGMGRGGEGWGMNGKVGEGWGMIWNIGGQGGMGMMGRDGSDGEMRNDLEYWRGMGRNGEGWERWK